MAHPVCMIESFLGVCREEDLLEQALIALKLICEKLNLDLVN